MIYLYSYRNFTIFGNNLKMKKIILLILIILNILSQEECAICFENLEKSNISRPFFCTHKYHSDCIDHWLDHCYEQNQTEGTCPRCRSEQEILYEFEELQAEKNFQLLEAALKNQINKIEQWYEIGANIDGQAEDGATPLIIAVENKNSSAAKKLLELGANPNISDDNGFFPLLLAIEREDLNLVESLINAGADVNKKGAKGFIPITLAAKVGNLDILNKIIEANADISDAAINNLLIHSADNGQVGIVQSLIDAGVDLNKSDSHGWTALMMASFRGHTKIVEALVKGGADSSIKIYGDTDATQLARNNGYDDIVEIIENK